TNAPFNLPGNLVRPGMIAVLGALLSCGSLASVQTIGELRRHRAAMGDWTTDAPGVRRLITVADLPPPNATPSSNNGPRIVPRPAGAWPKVPPGFVVELLAEG